MKRIISFILVLSMLVCAAATVYSEAPAEGEGIRYGDANGDGKVNVSDVTALLKYIAGWGVTIDTEAADVDLSEKVNLSDVVMLLKYLANWRVYLGGTGMEIDYSKQNAPYEDMSVSLVLFDGLTRCSTKSSDIGDAYTYVMYCARNEKEFMQFALVGEEAMSGLSVKITGFKDALGRSVPTEVYSERYMAVADKSGTTLDTLAEVLVPTVENLTMKANVPLAFGLKVRVPADANPGLYECGISVYNAEGKEIKRAYAYLTVWDFVLPEYTYCRSSIGVGSPTYAPKVPEYQVEYQKYYDMFIDNKLCPVLLPYSLDDERVTEYLDNPAVNSFLVAGEGYGGNRSRTDEEITQAYGLLSQNEEWLRKAYFYYNDEPGPDGVEALDPNKRSLRDEFRLIESNYARLTSLFPGAKIVIPNHYNEYLSDAKSLYGLGYEGDIIGEILKYSTLFCPATWMFTDPTSTDPTSTVFYTTQMVEEFGPYMERIDNRIKEIGNGEKWWYTSGGKSENYCNVGITNTGVECRELFWQQYLYGFDGFLYWEAADSSPVIGKSTRITDDQAGILVYAGKNMGVDGPLESVRLEFARDGIDDFDYLHLIEERFGPDVAMSFVRSITTDVQQYNREPEDLINTRTLMGRVLAGEISPQDAIDSLG